jgi:hypothetical protein
MTAAPEQAAVEAALVVLERMGLSVADLTAVPQLRQEIPTFAEYVPVVAASVTGDAEGVRVVLEQGDRPVGRAAAG